MSLVRMMIGAYPAFPPSDPEAYLSNLISILTMYDAQDAAAGAQRVMATSKSLPSRYDVRQACETAARDRARSEHLRGLPPPETTRNRLARPADPPPGPDGRHPPGTILTNYDQAVAIYGTPIGTSDPRHSKFVARESDLSARPTRKPWRPWTHDELRAIYGIHPNFQKGQTT